MIKILILDDEKDFCSSLKDFFSEKGLSVFTACSGKDGIKLAEKEKPDFILLDIKMQEMDGIDVLKKLRGIHPKCKVIMVTGIASEKLKDTLIKAGVLAYVTKPVNLQDLYKIISEKIEKGDGH